MGHPVMIELTNNGLLIQLGNHSTSGGAQLENYGSDKN